MSLETIANHYKASEHEQGLFVVVYRNNEGRYKAIQFHAGIVDDLAKAAGPGYERFTSYTGVNQLFLHDLTEFLDGEIAQSPGFFRNITKDYFNIFFGMNTQKNEDNK